MLLKSNFSDTKWESDCNYLGVNGSLRYEDKSADYYFKRAESIILKGSHQAHSSNSHLLLESGLNHLLTLGSSFHLDLGLITSFYVVRLLVLWGRF